MKIGVVSCDIIRREVDKVIAGVPDVSKIIYLEYAQHASPEKLKQAIKEQIITMKEEVDVVFLGYGFCKSLRGIENEVDVPIVMPQVDDCISMLLTPKIHLEELEKEAGTWFMTPGWAELSIDILIKELQLERVIQYGKDPVKILKLLYANYKRGLYIDTGVGNNDFFITEAKKFCKDFNLYFEQTTGCTSILEETFRSCWKKS